MIQLSEWMIYITSSCEKKLCNHSTIAPLLTDLEEIRRRFDNRLKKING